jgi:hypothetical protein
MKSHRKLKDSGIESTCDCTKLSGAERSGYSVKIRVIEMLKSLSPELNPCYPSVSLPLELSNSPQALNATYLLLKTLCMEQRITEAGLSETRATQSNPSHRVASCMGATFPIE